ncbi:hypothetical protein [Moorena sp. SIO3H5]|uniref:hypothetical protein n=1 Tax=Moorena sp. SIO3H5 TaxID=2607834 RepID=UPI0013BAF3CF|nr:hypothetical protein [Moorena sp. SIO3H5]NEO71924.1 hypothetical protein [Moorena sp. SIO3H5]
MVSSQRSALWNRLPACETSVSSQWSAVSGQLCGTGFQPVKHRSVVSGQQSAVSFVEQASSL